MINKNVILEYKCYIKNPLTNSLINRAEYKKIPKSSYPVRMVQMDSIKSIAYCNGYQVILKIVIKHKIVQVVFISGIMICGKGIMLLVSAGNLKEIIDAVKSIINAKNRKNLSEIFLSKKGIFFII